MGVEEETSLLTRYCFSLISLGTYALRLCLVCVVDVRVRLRSSVGILEEALDLTVDLCTALFLHSGHTQSPLSSAFPIIILARVILVALPQVLKGLVLSCLFSGISIKTVVAVSTTGLVLLQVVFMVWEIVLVVSAC